MKILILLIPFLFGCSREYRFSAGQEVKLRGFYHGCEGTIDRAGDEFFRPSFVEMEYRVIVNCSGVDLFKKWFWESEIENK